MEWKITDQSHISREERGSISDHMEGKKERTRRMWRQSWRPSRTLTPSPDTEKCASRLLLPLMCKQKETHPLDVRGDRSQQKKTTKKSITSEITKEETLQTVEAEKVPDSKQKKNDDANRKTINEIMRKREKMFIVEVDLSSIYCNVIRRRYH